MTEPNIILTGFMATGKTTVGKLLAKHLGYSFVDTDQLIVERSGMPVAEIFEKKGEPAFRKMESDLAEELGSKEGLVVSTGGGMMLDPQNASALSRKGQIFCLVATPEEIFDRVSRDTHAKRPLLETADPMLQVTELLKQREKGYGQFSQMRTSAKTPDEITSNLIGIIRANPDLRLSITASDTHYDYIVGGGILPFVRQLAGINGPVAVITDKNVGTRYAESLGHTDAVITVDPGQQNKTLSTVESVCEELVRKGFDRSTTIIALGGSVISGLAGFVASVYMRGVDLVQCPTSLLAMADTSIGGKAGINLPQGKNLIGAFIQPKAVIADVATLRSLSPEEFSSGMAEVIKHGLIGGKELFERIKAGNWEWGKGSFQPSSFTGLQDLIAQAIQVKINIVQEDPFQKGKRALLNLGHTFAHAIEQASGHGLRHGEAVSMGLIASVNLSCRLGHCKEDLQQEVETVLTGSGLPVRIPARLDTKKIVQAIHRDKKRKGEQLRFILIRDIGDVFIGENVPKPEVTDTLEDIKEKS
ncbi:3-dehydroquinate synthase [Desulfospira joergensenii]|uniref:3-dehydroquinate synthase n=1 Tax=Desulfospira joergensenii TaxID=53329 RepID=UPI0003B3E492|nr:3-dehydroquinate synthase [Desulfospira joergensenii]